ncbi:MAG: hypothetical protein IJ150_04445 [Bacteroidales bacterium]|nr:hypothetical protein [Bacteroidales bacterium]
MKSKIKALIITALYFGLAGCANNVQNDKTSQENDSLVQKLPIIQSVNLGVIEQCNCMGGNKDFIEMNRLLDVDSVDVIELYWRQTNPNNGKFVDCSVKYEKKDSALTIWDKEGDKEHKVSKVISKEILKAFVNFPNIGWESIKPYLDVKNHIQIIKTEVCPNSGVAGAHGLNDLHLFIKSSSKEYVSKLKLKIFFYSDEDYAPMNPNGYVKTITLEKKLNSDSNIIEYSEPCDSEINEIAGLSNRVEVEILSAE